MKQKIKKRDYFISGPVFCITFLLWPYNLFLVSTKPDSGMVFKTWIFIYPPNIFELLEINDWF